MWQTNFFLFTILINLFDLNAQVANIMNTIY